RSGGPCSLWPVRPVHAEAITKAAYDTSYESERKMEICSALQDSQELFQFFPKLADGFLSNPWRGQFFYLAVRKPLTGTADGKPFFIQQAADLANHQYVVALVIAPVAPALYRLQLRKLLFPVAQDVRLDAAQLAHFTDGEITLPRN